MHPAAADQWPSRPKSSLPPALQVPPARRALPRRRRCRSGTRVSQRTTPRAGRLGTYRPGCGRMWKRWVSWMWMSGHACGMGRARAWFIAALLISCCKNENE